MCKYEKFKVLVNNRKEYDLVLDKLSEFGFVWNWKGIKLKEFNLFCGIPLVIRNINDFEITYNTFSNFKGYYLTTKEFLEIGVVKNGK